VSGWIEKLPSGRFRARYRGPDGTRHSIIVATRAEAKTFLAGAHTRPEPRALDRPARR
jgi:hypothetical protein